MTASPRQRRKIHNRNRILDAAALLIVTQGFENTSLREIAKKADYSPAAIYKYFSSKEELFQSLSSRENNKLLVSLDKVDNRLQPEQQLIEMCLLYIQFCLDNPYFLALINNLSSRRRTKDQPGPSQSPYLVFLDRVRRWVEHENLNLPDSYDTEDITYALWAQIHGMATLRLRQLKDFKADFDHTNRLTIIIYLSGIRKWVLSSKQL